MNLFLACIAVGVASAAGSFIGIYFGSMAMVTAVKKAFEVPK